MATLTNIYPYSGFGAGLPAGESALSSRTMEGSTLVFTRTSTGAARGSFFHPFAAGTKYTVRFKLLSSVSTMVLVFLRPATLSSTAQTTLSLGLGLTGGVAREIVLTGTTTSTGTWGDADTGLSLVWSSGAVGATLKVSDVAFYEGAVPDAPFFNGSTPDTPQYVYAWTGAVDASPSTRVGWLTVALIPTAAFPQPVRVTVDAVPAGTPYRVQGTASDGSLWLVPGGEGIGTGEILPLIDNRAAINTPVSYRLTLGVSGAETIYTSGEVEVYSPSRAVIQSLDGKHSVPIDRWFDNGLPLEPVVRSMKYDVEHRSRPPARFSQGGDGGGALEIRTSRSGTAILRQLLRTGKPVVLRSDGSVRDWPAVELLYLDSAPSALWSARDASTVSGMSDARVWRLGFTFADDPEPGTPVTVWDWEDFDAFWTGQTWNDFDAFSAGQTWNDFDTTAWE